MCSLPPLLLHHVNARLIDLNCSHRSESSIPNRELYGYIERADFNAILGQTPDLPFRIEMLSKKTKKSPLTLKPNFEVPLILCSKPTKSSLTFCYLSWKSKCWQILSAKEVQATQPHSKDIHIFEEIDSRFTNTFGQTC